MHRQRPVRTGQHPVRERGGQGGTLESSGLATDALAEEGPAGLVCSLMVGNRVQRGKHESRSCDQGRWAEGVTVGHHAEALRHSQVKVCTPRTPLCEKWV